MSRAATALVGAQAGVRVVHTMIGGFDTHSSQRGAHDERMREVADALTAFAADLDRRRPCPPDRRHRHGVSASGRLVRRRPTR